MHTYHHDELSHIFHELFVPVNKRHNYNRRFIFIEKTRTNFGIFNIRYEGPKIWNLLSEDDKILSLSQLKTKLKLRYIETY